MELLAWCRSLLYRLQAGSYKKLVEPLDLKRLKRVEVNALHPIRLNLNVNRAQVAV